MSVSPPNKRAQKFLCRAKENEKLNQYWYSSYTISKIVQEIENLCVNQMNSVRIAFLSTPSIYFALPVEIMVCISLCFIGTLTNVNPCVVLKIYEIFLYAKLHKKN